MDGHRVAIIIPAFNEAATIGSVVTKVRAYGEVIVVSDGSLDQTTVLARAAGATVVELTRNNGYEGALNAGFAEAAQKGAAYMVTIDADGQHPDILIPTFLQKLEKGADVVVGVRDRQQRVGEILFCWVGKIFFGIDDPLCGMKGYRRALYEALGYFDRHQWIGTELLFFAAKKGCNIEQVPVTTAPRFGRSRFGSGLRSNGRMLKALFEILIGLLGERLHIGKTKKDVRIS